MSRRRTLPAGADAVWAVVADPLALPRWWPGVERVEEATAEAWTKVFEGKRGKAMRADFTRIAVESPSGSAPESPHRLEWRQELVDSPFERFMSEAHTRVSLVPAGEGATRVELDAMRRLRGLARLGWPLVRRATRRQLDQALAALEAEVAGAPSRSASGRRRERR